MRVNVAIFKCFFFLHEMYLQAISKRTGPTDFPLKSEPFIPSTGNFQGIIFHPCMVYHILEIVEMRSV